MLGAFVEVEDKAHLADMATSGHVYLELIYVYAEGMDIQVDF